MLKICARCGTTFEQGRRKYNANFCQACYDYSDPTPNDVYYDVDLEE